MVRHTIRLLLFALGVMCAPGLLGTEAEYCAAGDVAKFASYQKTLNYVIEFATEHGITGAYNRKFAYAGSGYDRGFNLKKPETVQYRTMRAEKPNVARGGITGYKSGRFWDGLITDKESARASGLSGKKADDIAGSMVRLKRLVGGEIKADSAGNFYKFDPAHQSAKIHLEKIVKKADGFWGVAEVDPLTGDVIREIPRRHLGK